MATERQNPLVYDLNESFNGRRHGCGYIPTPREEYERYASIAPADYIQIYPPKVDLTSKMTDVKDQGLYEACVGFAVCAALEIVPNSIENTQDESESRTAEGQLSGERM
ncbi:hypothetical protein BGW41_000990 [Actinomortierella wolfii]|nr:hypothetical protein BGW41_000990 [Actinomortierella wolfii]